MHGTFSEYWGIRNNNQPPKDILKIQDIGQIASIASRITYIDFRKF